MCYIQQQIPLGQSVPRSIHAVCSSLPTMADVIAYEEKAPEVMALLQHGYPRFVQHACVLRAAEIAARRHNLAGRAVYAVASARSAWALAGFVGAESHAILPEGDFIIVHFPDGQEVRERAHAFLQHTGASISSRQAEDYLAIHEPGRQIQDEVLFTGDSQAHMAGALAQYMDTEQLWLTNCGMNAFYAAICATNKLQSQNGRNLYLQLGWLYLDTQRVLEKLIGESNSLLVQLDVYDREALEGIFREHGNRLAAVVTELPTNPLAQTPDVEHLSALCCKHGVVRVFDPSVAGVANVDVLPHCDLLVTSLTKYAAWAGDVMIGAVALNEASGFAEELAAELARLVERPYPRDLARLAAQIDDMPEVVAGQNANAIKLVDYLEQHPAVKRIFHPMSDASARNFQQIARSSSACGSIVTVELNKPLAEFYDRSTLVKGPSFGTNFSMMCPFLYLAHYDLVSTEAGRRFLRDNGLEPELVRLSAGIEPFEAIRSALEAGLKGSSKDSPEA